MTQEQYEKLSKYENNLRLAYKSKQLSALTSNAVLELAVIFNELGYNLDNRQCGHCVVQMCAKLGELYFRYAEAHKEPEWGTETVEEKPKQPKKPIRTKTDKQKTSKKENEKD